MKNVFQRKKKPGSISYYVEKVIGYRAQCEAGYGIKDGYPPVVLELLLGILIGVRSVLYTLCGLLGLLTFAFIANLL